MDLKFPPGISPLGKDLITRMVVKDPDSRLGAHDIDNITRHPYFEGVEFEGAHLRQKPVLSLVDICLQKVGRRIHEFKDALAAWNGVAELGDSPEVGGAEVAERWQEIRNVLERMAMVQKW